MRKKSIHRKKRLAQLVQLRRSERKRVMKLTGRRIAVPTAADLIRRKFPESRLPNHKGMSDRGVGTAMCSL